MKQKNPLRSRIKAIPVIGPAAKLVNDSAKPVEDAAR